MLAHERSKARRHADSLFVEYLTRKTGTNFFVHYPFYRSNIQRDSEVEIPPTLILHTLNKIPDRTLGNDKAVMTASPHFPVLATPKCASSKRIKRSNTRPLADAHAGHKQIVRAALIQAIHGFQDKSWLI